MDDGDDRLAGDPVWELFPTAGPAPARRYLRWLMVAALVALASLLFPPLAVVTACLAVVVPDFRTARQLARSIPDKSGGTVCARFTYAWGTWKLGIAAFVLMLAAAFALAFKDDGRCETPPPVVTAALMTAALLCMGGFTASAVLTASGLLAAYRSGMRVWIGEGVNQARTLLLGMLIVGFTLFVLVPSTLWMMGRPAVLVDRRDDTLTAVLFLIGFMGCLFVGPVIILLALDSVSRRIVADRPGKFGPRVPTVGKWTT